MLKEAIKSIVPVQIYDRFRRGKQERLIRHFENYVAEHNYAGMRLKMLIADPVGQEWYDRDEPHITEIEFLKRFDLQGRTIFDLGAHQCLVAMLLAELAGKQGKVVAVEANAHNQKVSQQNLATNGYSNVTCLNALISSGKLDIAIDGGLNGRARPADTKTPKVSILTIDEMTKRFGAPGLILLDIEGHEIEALGGALETLADPKCHWLIELHGDAALGDYGHKNSDIFRFFPANLFNAFVLDTETDSFKILDRDQLPHDRCHVVFERMMQ